MHTTSCPDRWRVAGAYHILPKVKLCGIYAQVSRRLTLVHCPGLACCSLGDGMQLMRSCLRRCASAGMSIAALPKSPTVRSQAGRGARELVSPEQGAGDPAQHRPPTGGAKSGRGSPPGLRLPLLLPQPQPARAVPAHRCSSGGHGLRWPSAGNPIPAAEAYVAGVSVSSLCCCTKLT